MKFEDVPEHSTFRAAHPNRRSGDLLPWMKDTYACFLMHRATRLWGMPKDWDVTLEEIHIHFDHGPQEGLGAGHRTTSCGEHVSIRDRLDGKTVLTWKKSEVTCPACRKAMRGHKPPEGFSFADVGAFVVIHGLLYAGNRCVTAQSFARSMWPRSDAHFRSSNIGHGSTKGVGAWRVGGSMLNRVKTKHPKMLMVEGRYRNEFRFYPWSEAKLQKAGVL